MSTPNYRNNLEVISRALLGIHRLLLNFQKETMEALSGKQLSPHDVLGLSLGHPDFAWLRKLSTMIVRIDEATDDKEADLSSTHTDVISELRSLFLEEGKEPDFKMRLDLAQKKDPKLCLIMAEFKKFIQ